MNELNRSRPRNISWVEAIAALLVLTIWSAVFLAAVAVVLMYVRSETQMAVVAYTPVSRVAILATETPVPAGTPEFRTMQAMPAVSPSAAPDIGLAEPGLTRTSPAETPAALSTTWPQVPTPTFTRVIPATATAEQGGAPTPTPTLTPTFTPMPTYTVVPTFVYPAQVAMAADGGLVHFVSAGETLSGIAKLYGTTVESLVKTNQIDDPARLTVGQKLTIPERKGSVAPTAAPPSAAGPVLNSPAKPAAPPASPVDLSVPPPPAGDPPTRLVIPKINVDTPVIEVSWRIVEETGRRYSEWDVADNVAGWHHGSAFPGNVGNTVISGHHNIKGEVFRNLVDLEAGDAVYLYVGDQVYPYIVTEKHILREKGMPDEVRIQNARWIARTTDQRVTLVTCWPYTNNTHRVIVVARPAWK
jgi:sortase A